MTDTSQQKKRSARATAENILSAAKAVFQERGYDSATTREISQRANVNIALISRYHGSKLELFKKAVLPNLSLERFSKVPRSELGAALAREYAYGSLMKE